MAQAFPLETVDATIAYVGLALFGERLPPGGLEEILDRQSRDYLRQLLMPVIEQAADELPRLVAEIAERTGADADRLALLGFSAGGVVVADALIRAQVPIQAAVLVNTVSSPSAAVAISERLSGNPYPWDDEARTAAQRGDLAAHASDVAARSTPPALLILHGANDEYIAPDDPRDLYTALRNAYRESGRADLVEFRIFDDVAHHLTGANNHVEGLSRITALNEAASDWLNTQLRKRT
ncbi:alpha/beta hydrolase family protein [Mycobacterium celatum]|nr:prolyl oligopeptidase family serine peptidase [Mycobacterium celatum]ORV13476.1 hypothetical protein AWB95_11640 [Mycobacterium celatum]